MQTKFNLRRGAVGPAAARPKPGFALLFKVTTPVKGHSISFKGEVLVGVKAPAEGTQSVMTAVRRVLTTTAVSVALAAAAIPAVASAAEWAPTPVALPSGSTAGALQAVSCPAAGSCVAVGESDGPPDPNDLKPMVVTEAGGAWGQGATVGRPVGATGTTLLGVSCPGVGSCVAVGYEQQPSAYYVPKVPVVAVETGGTWGETFPITPPGGATYAILTSVSCPAAGSCMAVGGDESGPFAIAESDGT